MLLAAALFGTLLALPLYYQVDRGRSALEAGLLLAPQGGGAAVMLPLAGRLTDRIGGGPLVVAGSTVAAVATVPRVFLTAHTPYVLLGGVLFLRGLGLGVSIQRATAAAYAILGPSQVPHATAALNTLRQIGASVGTALIAVVLQHESSAALASATSVANGMFARVPPGEQKRIAGPLAGAFGHTFVWAVAMAAVAIFPALALLRAERTARRASGTVDFEGIDAECAPGTPRAA